MVSDPFDWGQLNFFWIVVVLKLGQGKKGKEADGQGSWISTSPLGLSGAGCELRSTTSCCDLGWARKLLSFFLSKMKLIISTSKDF